MLYIYLPQLNFILALGGLLLTVVTVFLFIDFFVYKGTYAAGYINRFFWPITMTVTIGSVALSLLYSEYFGFIPCSLCWLQRIAIYPQALMSVPAWSSNDRLRFPLYGIWLSAFGLIVALYQYLYQMLPKTAEGGTLPCLADGSNADCAVKVINEFGFVTFPFLSAITFLFLIALYLYARREYSVRP